METVRTRPFIGKQYTSSTFASTPSTYAAEILLSPGLSPLTVKQFIDFPPSTTPGNVGVAISGGSSRSMVAPG